MIARILSGLVMMTLLAACQPEPAPVPDSYPALWEISQPGGEVEGWLFGTIHALPDDVVWRSPRLDRSIGSADALVVEVANLEDGAKLSGLFEKMAYDRPSPPIRQRIAPQLRDEFDALLMKGGVQRSYFDRMESWAAALALAQIAQDGDSENGVDRALIGEFEGRRVIELEGAANQLSIFDSLPEAEQRDLLAAVLAETSDAANKTGDLASIWQSGDLERLGEITGRGILADPELKAALLDTRNIAWAARIETLLAAPERPLIAVGAGHLLGAGGLPALLERRGYTVRRID
ncbi:TraB/GumN family protein [Qipengyuania zhejiangensis]|uniref:TraB/GumN family protein n=1 Tax=Qipengyuania zhejiangensis TaxID=3077782 RepID=UPI002D765D27|nr:TraB/GumN family protein [Qipengyuania sp. Z2]